jgi:TP901 family phage tail tape measure protein
MVDLGTATGRIVVNQAFNGLGELTRAFAVIGGAAIAGLGVAVKTAADFEQGLANVGAVSGATSGQMEALRKKALQLGADTVFSATDAASAMEELVKAGLNVDDVLNGAADATVALAAAGGIDLPQAAAIAANSMNQFALKARDLPKIADLVAGAANASAISVSDFGHSLAQVGAVAHLSGLSFRDTALAITALGNAGIKGSDAGTSLKTFLQNLQPTTKKATTLMKELGIITAEGANRFFDASGKIRSMAEISQVLQTALRGQTQAQKLATLQTLFGSDAIRAAAVISNEGAAGFNKLAVEMGKVTAAQVAAKRLDTLKGAIEQMKGSAETAAIIIGTALLPQVRKTVEQVTDLINRFGQLSPAQQQTIVNFLVWAARLTVAAAAVVLLTRGVIIMVAAFRAAATAVGVFNLAMSVMIARSGAANASLLAARLAMIRFGSSTALSAVALNVFTVAGIAAGRAATALWAAIATPLGIAVIVITALAAAAVFAYNNFVPFRNIVNQIGAFFVGVWNTALASGKQALDALVSSFAAGTNQGQGFTTFFGALGASARFVWNVLRGIGEAVQGQLIPAFNTVSGIIQGALGDAWASIVDAWNSQLKPALIELWNTIQTQLVPAVRQAWAVFQSQLLPALRELWTALQPVIQLLGTAFIASLIISIQGAARFVTLLISAMVPAIKIAAVVIGGLITVLGAVATFIVGTVLPPIVRFITFLISGFSGFLNFLTGTVVPGVQSGFNGFMNTVRAVVAFLQPEINLVIAIFNLMAALVGLAIRIVIAVVQTVVGVIVGVAQGIGAAVAGIIGFFTNLAAQVQAKISQGFNAARSIVTSVMGAIRGFVQGAIANVVGIVNGLVSSLPAPFRNAFNGAKNAVVAGANNVISFVRGIPGRIASALGNLGGLLVSAGRSVIQGLISGIQSKISEVTGLLNHLTSLISQAKGPPEKDRVLLRPHGQWIIQSLIDGFDRLIPTALAKMANLTTDLSSVAVASSVIAPARSVAPAAQVSGNFGPVFQPGSIQVNAPQTMSPAQVAEQVARQVSYKLATGTTTASIPGVTV